MEVNKNLLAKYAGNTQLDIYASYLGIPVVVAASWGQKLSVLLAITHLLLAVQCVSQSSTAHPVLPCSRP